MPQAKSNIPTIAERLEKPQQLNSTVRSYSYSEYVEKRPDYVGFDKYGAGASWGNLARALDGFYTSFNRQANDVILPQWKERGEALGQEDFNAHSETDGYTKNRLAFKEFVEKHPEMANANPWVRVGYEKARLNTLALEMENGLQQAMIDNGIYNEEDESKAKLFAQSYIKHFKDEAGLTGYEDSVLLAKAFGSKEAQIYDGAIDQYKKVQNAEQQKKLANGVHDEMVSILTSTNMTDEQKNIAIQEALNRGREHGLLDSNAEALVPEVIKATYAITKSESLLDKCKTLEVNGRKLINWKGVPEWISAEKTRIAQREAAQAQKAEIAHQRFIRKLSDEGALYISEGVVNGKFRSIEEGIQAYQKEKGITLSTDAMYQLQLKAGSKVSTDIHGKRTEAMLPENQLDAMNTVDTLVATARTNGELLDSLMSLKKDPRYKYSPIVDNAISRTRTAVGKEGEQGERLEAKLTDESKKELRGKVKDVVTEVIGRYSQEDAQGGKKNVYYAGGAIDTMTAEAEKICQTHRKDLTEKWEREHQGASMLPIDKKEINAEAIRMTKEDIDNGATQHTDVLHRSKLIRQQNFSNPDAIPVVTPNSLYRDMSPEQIKEVSAWRSNMNTFLQSPSNPTNYRSMEELDHLVDYKAMMSKGISDMRPEYLVQFAKPKSPYAGASYDSGTNTFVKRYDPSVPSGFIENSIKMDGFNVKIDASTTVNAISKSKTPLSRDDILVINEVAFDKGLEPLFAWSPSQKLTQGDVISILRNRKLSDEQISDFTDAVAKKAPSEGEQGQQSKRRNSRRR